jgi:putative molybdopterin biosynthesis protein
MPAKHHQIPAELRQAASQQQFLDVVSLDEATERFHRHLQLEPLGIETVPLAGALNRILAIDVISAVDVSGFDRSNVDGFAVRAADTYGAMEEKPCRIRLNSEILSPGVEPKENVYPGTATSIATGGMVPRGADAVVMVEDTELLEGEDADGPLLEITRAVSPGGNVTFTGTDVARGETILRSGQLLTSREIGVLAAVGLSEVDLFRRPRVAIISTGNEIVPPGEPRPPGYVYDSNAAILTAAVEELGAEPVPLGVVSDDLSRLTAILEQALEYDVVVMSGGTSKGAGDLSYRAISSRLKQPGIVAHGVSLKPGKPVCLAVSEGKPVVILPGFPTSAIFTFHEFVAPVIRALAGRRQESRETVTARLPMRINSDRGRTEYLLVGLVRTDEELAAYPLGKGSGSVTTFSNADGFITIAQHTEIVEAGSMVNVQLLGRQLEPADLVIIGSHCVGLDLLVGELGRRGFSAKVLHVGSTGGLAAAKRGECDVAGVHLMDADTGQYNRPFLTPELELIPGYRRMQALVFRPGDVRFARKAIDEAIAAAMDDPECSMINRNAGSGTRILIDRLLAGRRPPGYAVQAKSHNAVATAITQGRADWGLAIDTVARDYQLASTAVQEEHYDFIVPKERWNRPAVAALRDLLAESDIRRRLEEMGFRL